MVPLLSILIPTLQSRQDKCLSLVDTLLDQVEKANLTGLVEIITLYDTGEKPTGVKRNELIQMAKGTYVCFFDDDDKPSSRYIESLFDGIEKDVDCCSLRGLITFDGENPEFFEHSLKYSEWKTTPYPIKYERPPNHLNCIKKSIANLFQFPEIYHGEDRIWSEAIQKSGLIKTEHYINEVIYHYDFRTNK